MDTRSLLALMTAIMHATRFDAQGFGDNENVKEDLRVSRAILKKVTNGLNND